MVIKTESCSFSEWRIYPGHGQRFVARDGRSYLFLSKKNAALSIRKVKAQKITWTTSWRRMNKKIKTDELAKKKKKKHVRVQRAIVGISLDDIRNKRKEKPEVREAQKEAALREIKARKQKTQDTKKGKATTAPKTQKKQEQKSQKKDGPRGKKR